MEFWTMIVTIICITTLILHHDYCDGLSSPYKVIMGLKMYAKRGIF